MEGGETRPSSVQPMINMSFWIRKKINSLQSFLCHPGSCRRSGCRCPHLYLGRSLIGGALARPSSAKRVCCDGCVYRGGGVRVVLQSNSWMGRLQSVHDGRIDTYTSCRNLIISRRCTHRRSSGDDWTLLHHINKHLKWYWHPVHAPGPSKSGCPFKGCSRVIKTNTGK